MARILERLAFWRKKQPKSELNKNRNNTTSRPIPQPTSSTNAPPEVITTTATSFLVPDLDDIRPFVTSTSNPISMRDLLNAISGNNPLQQQILTTQESASTRDNDINIQIKNNIYQQLSLKTKRKLDDFQEDNNQFSSLSSWNSSQQSQNQHTICRATHVAIETPTQSKKPKLVSINSSDQDIERLPPNHNPSSSPARQPIRPSSVPQPILGLPSHIWYQILSYNQLDTLQALIPDHPSSKSTDRTLQSTNAIRPSKVLANDLKLALDAQQNRHALIGICKTLSPIAHKAAWSTLVLGTARMVDRIAQRFEADSQLATRVQTCIITLLPPSSCPRAAIKLNTPRKSVTAGTPRTPKQNYPPSRPSHPSVRKIQLQNQPDGSPNNKQSLSLARQALITSSHSRSAQKCERFHSVLIPSAPLDKKLATSRNTKLNSISPSAIDKQKPRLGDHSHENDDEMGEDSEEYLNEIVLAGSLPSLFLSLARSIKVCCVVGEERLGTRGLKSLSVLSGLLGGLQELYIEGGGQFNDLATLVDGLRSSTIRGKGAALRVISITGPHSTLSFQSGHPVPPSTFQTHRIPSNSSTSTARSTLTCSLAQSTSSIRSSLSMKPLPNHLSLEHLLLGNGIPLTPERLHWLIVSSTAVIPEAGLRSLKVCLQADVDQPNLSSSVNSNSSFGSAGGRKTLSGRALLSRTFERIGGSLEWLSIDEDWNLPLTSSSSNESQPKKRVCFEGVQQPGPGEGIIEEPIAFCTKLESLSLPDGPLCSSGLLAILPFTLRTIEIFDVISSYGNREADQQSGFTPDDLWQAHSQAALFGLKTIRIVASSSTSESSSSTNHPIFKKWKRTPTLALDHLQRAGVQFLWIS
ncbi:hypothetical protein MJO29_013516 [Puccinia striiformis f. sp. tritici]|uniref:Uncharacterized protein n=1 Tax=Puccinia striiformis TaxID=27350 RepID=A0A2S4UQ15_9BASI|nr:hypothetical protein MJO29_013516 [Puccinia striiformis f. sp. tritici]POV99224.1 hypothetical protein PSHT_13623 [Puccinia striiformis]